jgi:hypothetical protein
MLVVVSLKDLKMKKMVGSFEKRGTEDKQKASRIKVLG